MDVIRQVYDPDEFRQLGHQLVNILADHLQTAMSGEQQKVLDYHLPEDVFAGWMMDEETDPMTIFQKILEQSIHLHHPGYMGHQVAPPAPLAALAGFMGLFLNNGGAIYEMAPATSALERVVCQMLRPYFGLDDADGILTSGGTIANLTALICARNVQMPGQVWQEGQTEKVAFMVSREAHYCIDRAIRIMGWGTTGAVLVPVDENFRMRTDVLEEMYIESNRKGIKILGVVGSAPSTSTGIYDDLTAIGLFCRKHDLWFHVDAAHGGPAVFSETYKHLMRGVELADSLVVDAHKMMMVPALTTLLLFRKPSDSYRTFSQKAEYLWQANDEEWFNYGKRTMECTKLMMSARIFLMIKVHGVGVFGQYVDTVFNLARQMADYVLSCKDFELAVYPDSNIVCFRFVGGMQSEADETNRRIRQQILEDGKFYIVQTVLHGRIWLRVSLMNAATTFKEIHAMMEEVRSIGYKLAGNTDEQIHE